MRTLKAVYNVAADENPYLKEIYPFAVRRSDRNKYRIQIGSGKKAEALTGDQIRAVMNCPTEEGSPEWRAKFIWLFSLHCQGMNFRDIALLRYSDIRNGSIHYIRKKTALTEAVQDMMVIPVPPHIGDIIHEMC